MSEFLKDQSIPLDLGNDTIVDAHEGTFLSLPEYRQAMLVLLALADEPVPSVGDCESLVIEISTVAFILDQTVNQVSQWGS
jgi:hypothetical protein